MQRFSVLTCWLFCTLRVFSQSFDFNDNCRQAYNAIIALRLDEGQARLQAEEKTAPGNLIPVYLENYIDFLRLYTTDDRQLYNRLNGNKDLRLELLKQGDRSSPYFLFCAAEINMQWATMSIQYGDYLQALVEIRKAFKFLEENTQRFPEFRPNKKSLGVLYALLGSVPDKYKWGVSLLGMEGNVERGLNDLHELVEYGHQHDFIFMEETVTLYAFLLFHLRNDMDHSWMVLRQNGFPASNNLMTVFTCAHIGIYGKHNDEALEILEHRPQGKAFTSFPLLTYLTALGKLHKLSPDANSWFKKFLAEYKGENHIKSSYQKIAWSYLLQNDTANYLHFIRKAATNGSTTVEADKQAQQEADSHLIPEVHLLRARLLFDGGYYRQAADEMQEASNAVTQSTELQTEYYYRLGRIYHEWGKTDSALTCYTLSIDKGGSLPRYFAANAALESGEIYEHLGNKEKAVSCYNLCLSFPEHEYKNGIDQKAKAALNRLK